MSIADLPRSANPVTWIWATALNRIVGGKRPFDISPGQRTFGPFLQDVARQVSPIPSAQAQTIPNTGYQTPPTMGPPEPLLNPPVPGGGSSGSSGQRVPPGGGGGGPRIPRGGTPPINPMPPVPVRVNWWPAAVISVIGPYVLPGAKRAGELGWEWYQQGRPLPKGPKTRRPKRPRRGPGPRETPAQSANNPLGIPQVIVNVPAPRPPRSERVADILADLGGDIYVNPKRRAEPAPAPPRPAPAPAPVKTPLWRTLLPLATPVLGLATAGGKRSSRRRDPLTQPQVDSLPSGALGNLISSGGLTLDQSSVATYLSSGYGGGTPGAVGTNTCECKAPRKKRRKKKRTVCYSGTYIERADGTRKTKRRKVQCL